MYEYRAEILDVVDGDTVHAEVDLGCDVRTRLTLRLAGIDAPEMRSEGKPNAAGTDAKSHLIYLVGGMGGKVIVSTIKDKRERYGRYLAWLSTSNGTRINDRMIEDGYAKAYDGGHR